MSIFQKSINITLDSKCRMFQNLLGSLGEYIKLNLWRNNPSDHHMKISCCSRIHQNLVPVQLSVACICSLGKIKHLKCVLWFLQMSAFFKIRNTLITRAMQPSQQHTCRLPSIHLFTLICIFVLLNNAHTHTHNLNWFGEKKKRQLFLLLQTGTIESLLC